MLLWIIKMKPLFDKTEKYNEDGFEFARNAAKVIKPLMEKWANQGFSANDMTIIIMDIVTMESTFIRMTKSMEKKDERKPKVPRP